MSQKEPYHANESDNEFYDACDSLAACTVEDNCSDEDDFQSMMPNFKEVDEEFMRRHEKLTDSFKKEEAKIESKFVPLHQKLNDELESKKQEQQESQDLNDESDEEAQHDPFYIDEEELEKKFSLMSNTELEQKVKEALAFKETGNALFKEEKYPEALEEYTKALNNCPLIFTDDRSVFHSNRSICFLKLKDESKCISECTKSIELNPKFIKPLLRRAECYQNSEKLEDALNDYKKLSELDRSNSYKYKRKCYELDELIKERNEKLKTEMMNKLKELGNMCLKPFGLSTNNFNFVQDPNTGSYSVNFQQN